MFHPLPFGPGAALALAVGAVKSMLMPVLEAEALALPALSVQVPEADCPAPSVLRTASEEQKSMPDRTSAPLKWTVTALLFHPLPFAPGEALALAVGAVLSMLIPLLVLEAELPALSSQVPVADWLLPSVAIA